MSHNSVILTLKAFDLFHKLLNNAVRLVHPTFQYLFFLSIYLNSHHLSPDLFLKLPLVLFSLFFHQLILQCDLLFSLDKVSDILFVVPEHFFVLFGGFEDAGVEGVGELGGGAVRVEVGQHGQEVFGGLLLV